MRDLLRICVRENGSSTSCFWSRTTSIWGKTISAKFQKHIPVGENMDLVNEKRADGSSFVLRDGISRLESDRGDAARYVLK